MRHASAGEDVWLGTTSDYDTASNWSYGRVPYINYGDVADFNSVTANLAVTLSAPSPVGSVFFSNTAAGYTIGAPGDTTDTLSFNDYTGINQQANLVGTGTINTVDATLVGNGNRLFIQNWSPTTAPTADLATEGVAGYGNTLVINGNIMPASGQTANVVVYGTGNVQINGNLVPTGGNTTYFQDLTSGAVTFAGTNSYKSTTVIGGTLILDDTTNNTEKLSGSSYVINLGTSGNNSYNNQTDNGAHLVFNGNATSASSETALYSNDYGASTIVVNGSTAVGGPETTLNLGSYTYNNGGASLDVTTTGNAQVIVGNGNYNNIIPFMTYGQTFWAANNGSGVVVGLTSDDGNLFNNQGGNYTVTAGGQTLSGTGEAANSVRFASSGTLDLGGGNLAMNGGDILVAAGVSADTSISDGSISQDRNIYGFDIINYGTGTLNISANIDEVHSTPGSASDQIGKDGSGTLELSGNNLNAFDGGGTFDINQGKVIMGSAQALGTGANINFGDSTATLDLHGNSLIVSTLYSNGDYLPGNAAAAAGLNSNIQNSVGGTISTLTIKGNGNSNDGNVHSGDVYGDVNLGWYQGGLNEAAGAIIALDVEQGNDTTQAEFQLGGASPQNDIVRGNTSSSGISGEAIQFTGAITVGQHANLGLSGYANIETLGVLTVEANGNFGPNTGGEYSNFATTYLTGTGNIAHGNGTMNFVLNDVGSVADTFTGTFGTASDSTGNGDNGVTGFNLYTGSGGTVILTNPIYSNGVTTTGTSTLVAPGEYGNSGINVTGESTFIVTGTGGNELGGDQLFLYGGTLEVAPTGSGQDVVATGAYNRYYDQMQLAGDSQLILNRGTNDSLTVELGSTSAANDGQFNVYTNEFPGLSIGSTQGLSALGNTDKFIFLLGPDNAYNNGPGTIGNVYIANVTHGIVLPSTVGVDDSANSRQNATFLTYNGTGTTADQGFTPYTYAAGNIDNIAGSTATSIEKIDDNIEILSQYTSVYALEMENGALLNLSGQTLGIGDTTNGGTNQGGLILNGAKITGTGSVDLNSFINSIYTDPG